MKSKLHRWYTCEHYTPGALIADGEYVNGGPFDLDPGSCLIASITGRTAPRYYSQCQDGLVQPWVGAVVSNPPGDRRGRLVRLFWRRACEHAIYGGPDARVLWIGFSLEQLRLLQTKLGMLRGRPCPLPSEFPMVIARKRTRWESVSFQLEWTPPRRPDLPLAERIRHAEDMARYAEAPARFALDRQPGKAPTNGNYFCLLGGDAGQRARFRERFGKLGLYTPGRHIAPVRDLEAELLAAVREHGPQSKRGLTRIVRARTSEVLAAIDRLLLQGRLVLRNRKIAFP